MTTNDAGGIVAGFSVSLDGINLGMWTEVDLGGMSLALEPRDEGGAADVVYQLRGRLTYDNIKLSRVVTEGSVTIGRWFRQQATEARRMHGEIVVYSASGTPLQRWEFVNAIPVRWTVPPMRSGDSAAVVETLEIAHQGFID